MTNKNSGLRVKPAMTIVIEYGLYLLAFSLPLGTRWIIKAGPFEYASYSLYGTDILLILLLAIFIVRKIASPRNREARNDRKVFLPIIGLIIISFVSVFFAINKPLALYKFGWLILGAGLFWLIVRADYSRAKLIWCGLAGLALQSLLAIWQFLAQQTFANKWLGLAAHRAADLGASVIETVGADGVGERWLRAYGGFDHPNILGGAMALGILILVGEMTKNIQYPISNNKTNFKFQISNLKIVSWTFFTLFSAALFFSFSRAGWLALSAGLAAMMAGAARKKNLPAQKNILQAILISGLVFFILFFQLPNLAMTRLYGGGRLENKSKSERLESIKNSLPIIKKNWLAGAGIGSYVLALEREFPARENYFYQPAHDVFLLVFSEIGIFGFLFYIGVIIFSFVRLLRRPEYGAPRNDRGTAILAALLVLLTFDHWLWSLHFGALFFWLVLGLMARKPDVQRTFDV